MGRKKVYCSLCKHYVCGVSDGFYEHCNKPMQIKIQGNWYRPPRMVDMSPRIQNMNNDCENYEAREDE